MPDMTATTPVHRLRIVDQSGDTVVEWRVGDDISTADANRIFVEMLAQGRLAYSVPADAPADGTTGLVIREFDETAPEIVMTPQLVGG